VPTAVTVDTGALVALERRDRRAIALFERARALGPVTVPAAVLSEWWRGQPRGGEILRAMVVEPLSENVSKSAGLALAKVGRGPSAIDAIVMASAAQRGDLVYTSDIADMERLRAVFREVRLLRV
jgi:predicted nucleic acid-binding protein